MSGPAGPGPAPRAAGLGMVVAGAVVTRAAWWGLQRHVPGGTGRWERTNHAGEPLTLLEGPAFVIGAAASTVGCPPAAVAVLGSGALGALDDLRQDTDRKGLRGHLQALRHRRVTTGVIKVAGLGLTGLLAAALADAARRGESRGARRRHCRGGTGRGHRPADALSTLAGGAVVAGAANMVNLLDLRPGRALKATTIAAVPLVLTAPGSVPAASAAGAALAMLPEDLAGQAMLGDTGANPAGALIGVALVQRYGLAGRAAALSVLTALTLASEQVSFTKVIESTPGLRQLDALGRPPRR